MSGFAIGEEDSQGCDTTDRQGQNRQNQERDWQHRIGLPYGRFWLNKFIMTIGFDGAMTPVCHYSGSMPSSGSIPSSGWSQ